MSRIRRIIGENLQKALREQAQLTSVVEVDVTALLRLRLRERAGADVLAREGVKLSPMPFFVKAAAQALKAHPAVNARINEGEGTITYFDRENVGIAVDTEKGLMTPVIKGAGDLSIAGIARATAELAGRARSGRTRRTTCRARRSRSPTPVRAARCSTRSSCRPDRPRSWAPGPSSSGPRSSRRRTAAGLGHAATSRTSLS
ncbi:hypothetical protein STENM327S_06649 [Streptomyces tendae]